MKALQASFFTLVTAAVGFCQAPAVPVEFEVASVKSAVPMADGQLTIGIHIDGAMVRCNYVTLRNLLTMAYDLKDYQITGPEWIGTEHYDIVAKIPAGASGAQLRPMIASLLTDRFKLVSHRETKDLPAYALIVGKGGMKAKESPPDTEAAETGKVEVNVNGGRGGTTVNLGGGSYMSFGLNKLEAKKVTIAAMLDTLGKFVDRPVVDETKLTARYDLNLEYSVAELKTMVRAQGADDSRIPDFGGDPTISIFSSLEAIGLKLDPRKAPVSVLVVDRVERTPTAN